MAPVPETNNGLPGRRDRLTKMDPLKGVIDPPGDDPAYNVFARAYATEQAMVQAINDLDRRVTALSNPFTMAAS